MTKMRMSLAVAGIAAVFVSISPSLAQSEPTSEFVSDSEPGLSAVFNFVDYLTGDDAPATAPFAGFVAMETPSQPIVMPLPSSEMLAAAQDEDMADAAPTGAIPGGIMVSEAGHGGGGHMEHHGPLSGPLALTDDQYERLFALKQQFLDQAGPKMFEKMTLERHMRNAMLATDIDAKQVKDLETRLNSVKSELGNMKVDHLLAAAQVLTPEQRKAVHSAMIKHALHGHAGMMGGHHHGGPMHGGPMHGGPMMHHMNQDGPEGHPGPGGPH